MTSRAQEIPQYYFAFGSNMHIAQMASRCPDSRIFAKGILRGYRWQINQRGVANVVRCKRDEEPEPVVEGILFTVSSSDIRTLDRTEGISKQFYDKALRWVEVGPLAVPALKGEQTTLAVDKLKNLQASDRMKGTHKLNSTRGEGFGGEEVEALVYLSGRYRKDGQIRSEYVQRMKLAMSDALKLGINEFYLQDSLYALVFGEDSAMVSPDQPGEEVVDRKQGQDCGSPKDHELDQNRTEESESTSENSQVKHHIGNPIADERKQRKSRHHRRHSLPSRDPSKEHYSQSPRTQNLRSQRRQDETTMDMLGANITGSGVASMVDWVMDIGLNWLFGNGNEGEPGRT